MEKPGFVMDDSTTGELSQTNPRESLLLVVQRCCEHLDHVWQCTDANCKLPSCQKYKKVVQHAKSCKQKAKGGCQVCEVLFAPCYYHAKHCQEAKCPVPFCVNIKNTLRQPKLQKKLQQVQVLRRHIVTMLNGMSGAVLQSSSRDSNSFSQPSTSTQIHSSSHSPLQNIQAEVAIQTVPHVVASKYDKIMGGLDSMPNSIGNSIMGLPQVMPNPGPSIAGIQRSAETWQQFLQTLKSLLLSQKYQQVLAILKSNVDFIKQRAAQQQKHVEQHFQEQQQQQQHVELLQQHMERLHVQDLQHVEQLNLQEQQQQQHVEQLHLQELQQLVEQLHLQEKQ